MTKKRRMQVIGVAAITLAFAIAGILVTIQARAKARYYERMWKQCSADNEKRDSLRLDLPQGTVANSIPMDWRMVESPDYVHYIANIRAIGVPWDTIKDIIFADVNALYAQKTQALRPSQSSQFWETKRIQTIAEDKARNERLSTLEAERKRLLLELVGIDSNEDKSRSSGWQVPTAPTLEFLTEEKRRKIAELDKYDLALDDLIKRVGSTWLRGDYEAMKRLQSDKRSELGRILTPDELENYDLVTHPIADQMRGDLGTFNPTEEEFRMVFQIRKEFADKVGEFQMKASLNPNGPPVGLQMAAASKEADQQIAARLGPERYADYERSQDPLFLVMERVSQHNDLSDEAVLQAYQIKKAADQERAQLATSNVGTEQELEWLQGKLLSVQQNEEKALRQVLSDKGFDLYSTLNPGNANGFQQPQEAIPR
jgi:hypothetical protein